MRPIHASWQYLALFAVGLVAGAVDSVAGGGGLLTVPALLYMGLHPSLALGTNKLQSTFGSASATFHYARAAVMPLRDCARTFFFTVVGAVAGALCVQRMSAEHLRVVIPFMLAVTALFVLLRPRFGDTDRAARIPRWMFDVTSGLTLGFYDGFFGPGTGTFWVVLFVLGLGFNIVRATGYTKAMNFGSNAAALAVFVAAHDVLWGAGLLMGVGQLLGAGLGARLVVLRGARFVRPVFLAVVLALTARLLFQALHR